MCLACHKSFPVDFTDVWTNYLYPIVSTASVEQLDEMHRECSQLLWAAMVAENMGQSHLLSLTKIGCADVADWSVITTAFPVSVRHGCFFPLVLLLMASMRLVGLRTVTVLYGCR